MTLCILGNWVAPLLARSLFGCGRAESAPAAAGVKMNGKAHRDVIAKRDAVEKPVDPWLERFNAKCDSIEKSLATLRRMLVILIILVIVLYPLIIGFLLYIGGYLRAFAPYPARVPGAYYGYPTQTPCCPREDCLGSRTGGLGARNSRDAQSRGCLSP